MPATQDQDAPTPDALDVSQAQATVQGDGPIAQGDGAVAVGKGGVYSGGDNHGVINVDNRKIKIFSQSISRRQFVLVIGAVGGIVALGSIGVIKSLRPRAPDKMTGEMNVALARFGVSQPPEAATGFDPGQILHDRIAASKAQLKGLQLGSPELTQEISNAVTASKRAREINATVLIYGVVSRDGTDDIVVPSFFVSPAEEGFHLAAELAGEYRLGTPIRGNLRSAGGRSLIADRLQVRADALVRIVLGVSLHKAGEFEKAIQQYEDANRLSEWTDSDGKEVLQFLLAASNYRLRKFDVSIGHATEALRISPGYARAYLALGFNFQQKALETIRDDPDAAIKLLEDSLIQFKSAELGAKELAESDVGIRVVFGRNESQFALAELKQEDHVDALIVGYKSVIDAYGRGERVSLRELAAESYGRLGLLYNRKGDLSLAVESLTNASALHSSPERKALFKQQLDALQGAQK